MPIIRGNWTEALKASSTICAELFHGDSFLLPHPFSIEPESSLASPLWYIKFCWCFLDWSQRPPEQTAHFISALFGTSIYFHAIPCVWNNVVSQISTHPGTTPPDSYAIQIVPVYLHLWILYRLSFLCLLPSGSLNHFAFPLMTRECLHPNSYFLHYIQSHYP